MRRFASARWPRRDSSSPSGMALDYAKQSGATAMPAVRSIPVTKLRAARGSSSDLEVGGELAGLPPGVTRYITREDLLTLPTGDLHRFG